jgi:cytochrome c oxidase subunit 3
MAHEHDKPAHPYHLVEASIWPLLSALAAGLLAFGAVSYMHDWAYGALKLKVGFLGVAVCMFFWWRDVIRESFQGFHTKVVQIGLRYGVVLFIASEVMFFVAFFWAYFDNALFPKGGVWPPEGIKTFNPFDLPLLNTLILLLSGCTVTWAHHALLHKDRKGLVQGLAASVILGVIFLACQMFEYSHAAFGLKDGIYAATFYLATGFHGFHVFVGTVFLFVCWRRAVRGDFTAENHVGFEAAAWYWHFVDVVWLFLFLGIYVFGA